MGIRTFFGATAAAMTLAGCAVAPGAPDVPDCTKVMYEKGGATLSDVRAPTTDEDDIQAIVAIAKIDFGTKQICYELKGNGLTGVTGTTVTPGHFCLDLANPKTVDVPVTVTVGMDEKTARTFDVTDFYGVMTGRDLFKQAKMDCEIRKDIARRNAEKEKAAQTLPGAAP